MGYKKKTKIKRLFLGHVPDDFEISQDEVLGGWCFLENPSFLSSTCNSCQNPFENIIDLEEAENHLANTIIPLVRSDISVFLYKHWEKEISEPIEFYQEITEPWLTWFCQTYWFLYKRLIQIIQKNPESCFSVYFLPDANAPSFTDTSDYSWKMQMDSEIYEWISSRIAEMLHVQKLGQFINNYKPQLDRVEEKKVNKVGRNWINYITRSVASLKKQSIYHLRCYPQELKYHYALFFSLFLAIKPIRLNNLTYIEPLKIKYLSNKKSCFSDLDQENQIIIKNLSNMAIRLMPSIFTNNLSDYLYRAQRISFKSGKFRIVSSNIYDDYANIINYLSRKKKEKSMIVQHGGGYGIHRVFPLVQETEYRHDFFISWGWKTHGKYKVNALPLPSPMISSVKYKIKRRPNGKLLFINYSLQPLVLRFQSKPFGSTIGGEVNKTKIFFNKLDPEILANTVYRPHSLISSFEHPEYLKSKYPKITVNKKSVKEFLKEMKSSRIIILNHPLTAFHIGMAVNIPMVCYWDPDLWGFTDECMQDLIVFYKLGAILDTPENAALKVNSIWPDVENWWKDATIQKARQKWSEKYAFAKKDWMKTWIGTLWRL